MRFAITIIACLATGACGTTGSTGFADNYRIAYGPAPIAVQDASSAQLATERLALANAALGVSQPPATLADVTPGARLSVAIYYMGESDTACSAYLDQLGRSQRTWRSTLAILGNLFGIAGGIATPERSKSLLSALAGGMIGVRGNLDEGILSNQASHLIRAANFSLRGRIREDIIRRIRDGDLSQVGLPVIVQEVQGAYHTRCGIDEALGELARQVGAGDVPSTDNGDDGGDGQPSGDNDGNGGATLRQ